MTSVLMLFLKERLKLTDTVLSISFYFPQHTIKDVQVSGEVIERVPNITERKSYHYHTMGKMVHMNLDSGYMTYFPEQVPFINDVFNTYPDYIKIVNYHNPAYYACEEKHDNAVQDTLFTWIPLFDKYRVMSSF